VTSGNQQALSAAVARSKAVREAAAAESAKLAAEREQQQQQQAKDGQ